ncbi:MAG: DUF4395 family protein [Acidobacteriota bacterium]|jgi:hypothetical protein
MASRSVVNFVRQQGFREPSTPACEQRFAALSLQPRIIGVLVVVALILQSSPAFLALSALLWWNVLVPRWNPFDALHNRFFARRSGRDPMPPAPAPRRFAQGMAASFMLGIGLSLQFGWVVTGYVLQGMLVVALSALLFGNLCLGSYVYHLIRGEVGFANRTLPWGRGDAMS